MARILLAEDDDSIAELAVAGLRARGYEVVRTSNGAEALAEFDRDRPEIVITDLVMPVKEGWSLIADLRRRAPDLKIVAMSGGGLDTPRTYLKLAQHVGATVTLQKPFTLDQLMAAITRLNEPSAPEPALPAPRPRPPHQRRTPP